MALVHGYLKHFPGIINPNHIVPGPCHKPRSGFRCRIPNPAPGRHDLVLLPKALSHKRTTLHMVHCPGIHRKPPAKPVYASIVSSSCFPYCKAPARSSLRTGGLQSDVLTDNGSLCVLTAALLILLAASAWTQDRWENLLSLADRAGSLLCLVKLLALLRSKDAVPLRKFKQPVGLLPLPYCNTASQGQSQS